MYYYEDLINIGKNGGVNKNLNNLNINNPDNSIEILNLKNQLKNALLTIEKQKLVLKELEYKLNTNEKIINKYRLEINNLNAKLRDSLSKSRNCGNEIMSVYFISSDKSVNIAIPCLNNNTFAEVEEKLYQRYPKYREKNNNFICNGIQILRFKTIEENRIRNDSPVILIL